MAIIIIIIITALSITECLMNVAAGRHIMRVVALPILTTACLAVLN